MCGEPAIGDSWVQFDLRFYVVALLFIIFDVEVAFDRTPVAGTLLRITTAKSHHFGSFAPLVCQIVDPAHETNANYACPHNVPPNCAQFRRPQGL